MSEMSDTLRHFGAALEQAVAADIAAATAARRRRRRARGGWLWLFAAALGLTGVAAATHRYFDEATVARSLPAGTLALLDTQPTCTEVRPQVEFHCVLDVPPQAELADWSGTGEPALDDDRRVIGGCRALDASGTTWRCYMGREAVVQGIIAAPMLGTRSPGPAAG